MWMNLAILFGDQLAIFVKMLSKMIQISFCRPNAQFCDFVRFSSDTNFLCLWWWRHNAGRSNDAAGAPVKDNSSDDLGPRLNKTRQQVEAIELMIHQMTHDLTLLRAQVMPSSSVRLSVRPYVGVFILRSHTGSWLECRKVYKNTKLVQTIPRPGEPVWH